MGYPSIVALILAFALILIPVELGYLFYQGKKMTGRLSLQGVISYRNSIPWWQYLAWSFVIFISVGAIFTLLKPVDAFLQERLFSWMPVLTMGWMGIVAKTLIVTYSLVFIFVAILAPLVEELYFRGYLLPRMKGKYAGLLLHSFLFAVQHVLEPWMIITRTLGILPILFWGKKRRISKLGSSSTLCVTR